MYKLQDLNIAISAHEYFKGSPQELKDFLLAQKIKKLTYVAHMFPYMENSISHLEVFEQSNLVAQKKSPVFKGPDLLFYLRDAIYNFLYLFFSKETYDVYIGVDSFNAFFGVLLKKLGKTKMTVFFTIDYIMKNRFKSAFLNKIYVFLDRFAFYNSDYTWNVSSLMTEQRIKELGDSAKEKIQIEVPIGAPVEEAEKLEIIRKNNILVYSGTIAPLFGLEFVVESLPDLVKAIPNLELRIFGKGPLEKIIPEKIKSMGFEKNLNFLGYIDSISDHNRVLSLLKESTLGLALYEPTEDNYKKYSDVTKPKDYMACGLPVITTNVVPISNEISEYNLGRVVTFDKDSFVSCVKDLLLNENERIKVQENVKKYIVNITWENIYKKVFNEMDIS